ncbi:MAG: hypothetical protein SFY92_04200 [Verrucomicrobiae bacterium]|nr:hypothetical protein [Verrucomicrobiae bacterium]
MSGRSPFQALVCVALMVLTPLPAQNAPKAGGGDYDPKAEPYVIKKLKVVPDLTDGYLPANLEFKSFSPGAGNSATVALAYDEANLYLFFQVTDASAMRNSGVAPLTPYMDGDALELVLGRSQRKLPDTLEEGDVRFVFVPLESGPVCIAYRPVVGGTLPEQKKVIAGKGHSVTYDWGDVAVGAEVAFKKIPGGYSAEAKIPQELLGVKLTKGLVLWGDVGAFFSVADGSRSDRRGYLFNKYVREVSDVAEASELHPRHWGVFKFE